MEKQSRNYCVILAGGRGKRLWPSSRKERPKQFVDFFGTGRTLLQSTFDRMAKIVPQENIFVCTSEEYQPLVREQLPGVDTANLLIEPVNRNTAPSVAWAGVRIHRRCEQARIIVVPTDQFIVGEEAFRESVLRGLDFVAENDIILTMGIRPSRPEPGYGYIQMGEPSLTTGINKVQSFTEKPERDFARIFMESEEFLWNTGMFMANVDYLREFFAQVISDMPHRLAQLIDVHSAEMSDNAFVMRCNFGWADLGTWHSIYEFMQHQTGDNVVIDSEVLLENCSGNIIKLPKGHIGVINGLEGYIVAEQGDVLLICKKGDSSALIRKYVSEVGIRYGETIKSYVARDGSAAALKAVPLAIAG